MKTNHESTSRLDQAREAEKSRLAGLDYLQDIFIPTGPPGALLPPNMEPRISMREIIDLDLSNYAALYYERSGRYLGVYEDRLESAWADKYRFARCYLPGGVLPWES